MKQTGMTGFGSAFGRVAASALMLALVACGSDVEVVSTHGTGAGGSSSSSGTNSGGASSSSTSSGSGGTAGASTLPEPTCAPGEAAIVVATGSQHAVIAVGYDGAWTQNPSVVAAPAFVTPYVDVSQRLAAFWIGSGWQTHYATTADGASFDVHDVNGWEPYGSDQLVAVTNSVFLGADSDGVSLARFDPDALDWYPYLAVDGIDATSAAPLAGEILVIGLGPNQELCDVATQAGAWGAVHCRDDVEVATAIGGEINVTLPRAVALPNGDIVVVYYQKVPDAGLTLAATALHAGAWSAPEAISPESGGIAFAAAATPAGEVIVGVAAGAISALRYAPGAGWSAPIPIDPSAGYDISVAPGICGDDALIAYSGAAGGAARVARVRGNAAEAQTVVDLGEDTQAGVSVATRHVTVW